MLVLCQRSCCALRPLIEDRPRLVAWLRARLAFSDAAWEQVLVLLILASSAGLSALAHVVRSTHLLGAFMAGVSFASVDGAAAAFDSLVAPVSAWTSRVFFGSIGFVIPLGRLFSAPALGYGALLSIVAIATKVVTGIFDWDLKWEIGVAMVRI